MHENKNKKSNRCCVAHSLSLSFFLSFIKQTGGKFPAIEDDEEEMVRQAMELSMREL